jgi:mono/diheme cytochrome c family protein
MQGGNVAAGRAVFSQYCSQCHGQDGKSGHAGAPDISIISVRQQITYAVLNGKNAMPTFSNVLTPEQARDVIEFVSGGLK